MSDVQDTYHLLIFSSFVDEQSLDLHKRTPSNLLSVKMNSLIDLITEKICGCCVAPFHQVSSNLSDDESRGENDLDAETTQVCKQTIDRPQLLQSPPHDQRPKATPSGVLIDPPTITRHPEFTWIFLRQRRPTPPIDYRKHSLIHYSQ